MRTINVILAFLVPLALGLALFEGGLRLIGQGPEQGHSQFHPQLGWAKKPNATSEREGEGFEVTFEFNELGLRDDPMDSPAKPEGSYRVLVLGDSFTLGYTVARKDLFVDILENWWRREDRPVDVVNTGTEGYSTDQEAVWLMEYGAEYEPDLVLLVPYENDIYWNGQPRYGAVPKPLIGPDGERETGELEDPGPKPASQRWAVAKLLSKFAPRKGGGGFTPEGGRNPIERDFAPLLTDPPEDVLGDCFERTRGSLIAVRDTCQELGAKLVVAPIPSHSAVEPEFAKRFGEQYLGLPPEAWSPDRPVDFFLTTCAELGIPAVDARAALKAATTEEQSCYFNFFEGFEWHFNPHGNRAYAEFLHAELDRLDAIPPTANALAEAPPAEEGDSKASMPTWLMVFVILWLLLSGMYVAQYREEGAMGPAKVFALLAVIFAVFLGLKALIGVLPPTIGTAVFLSFGALVIGFVAYKLGNRLATIGELFKAFVLRGHWYLMPVVVVLLTVGSLLVVAASSPLVAPFIYTLF